jgi:hypothetical protein
MEGGGMLPHRGLTQKLTKSHKKAGIILRFMPTKFKSSTKYKNSTKCISDRHFAVVYEIGRICF